MSINISNGSNIIESNVGTGTYLIESLTGTTTITVTNDIGCNVESNFSNDECKCNNPLVPTDEPCDAPSVDLSQSFYGSTTCPYTVNTADGPADLENSNLCVGGGFVGNNDSWLKFISADDSIVLDWEVYNCLSPPPDPIGNGVQFGILSGDCSDEDGMTALACEWQAFAQGKNQHHL